MTAGRILTALAAVGLLLFALFGTVARPRLSADTDGIEIRRLGGRQRWAWGAVRISVSSTGGSAARCRCWTGRGR